MSAMMGHFNMLACFESTSELELEKALKKQVVNFNAEFEKNQEFSIQQIFELLPKEDDGKAWVPVLNRDDEEYGFDFVSTKLGRENLSQAFRLCKNARALLYRSHWLASSNMMRLNIVLFPSTEKLEDKLIHIKDIHNGFLDIEYFEFSSQIPIAIVLKGLLEQANSRIDLNLCQPFSKIKITSTEALTHSYESLFTRQLKNDFLYSNCQQMNFIEKINLTLGLQEQIPLEDVKDLKDLEVKQYAKDWFYFMASFQKACQDPRFRKEFLLKINKDEAWFRKLAEVLTYKARAQRSQTRTDNAVYKKYDRDFFYPCYLEADDQNRQSRLYREALKKLDTQFHAGQVVEDLDLREYSPGDPVRHVNWKATGRSRKIYVAKQPRTEVGINTPLHVLINIKDSTLVRLQMLELVRTLQQDIKRTNREIFIAFKQAGYYVKLSPRIDPKVIVQSLMDNQPKNQVSHLDSRGRPVNNLVYVSNDYNAISGMEYLYKGLPRRNISSIYLKDPKYDVYPQIDKAWAEEAK